MKIGKKIIILFLAAALGLSVLSGCQSDTSKQGIYEIWGTYNSVKVQQDLSHEEYADVKLPAQLNIEGARNEYESGQLIISAETDVSSFNAEISDLTGPDGAKILKSDIKVQKERYIHVKANMTLSRPFKPGWYPDALVPMDAAYAKGENFIKAGENQGIYVTIYLNKDLPAGTYKGILEVTVDEEKNQVPVNVEVWNFTIPDEVHTKSAFYNRREWIVNGELDNSMEMYTKYYEQLLDYRISGTDLPYEDPYDTAAFVDLAKKYVADPKCSAFSIPYKTITRTVELENPSDPEQKVKMITDIDYDLLRNIVEGLARASTPELNLLEKAYMYFISATDEPQYSGAIDNVRHITVQVNRLFEEMAEEWKEDDPNFFTAHGLEENDLLKMPMLVTTYKLESLDGYVSTYVPQYQHFDTAAEREGFYASMKNDPYASGEVWWYGCWQPTAPYPTYHIDDYLLTSRTLSWMQYEYGVSGNLYWGTANYAIADNNFAKPTDVWEEASRFVGGTANGDGFLVYPGIDYGVDGPLPSMRLESIRDGLEDYEYLWMFEQAMEKANEKYGTNIDSNTVLEPLFRRLYTGVVSTTDSAVFEECRRELAQILELISVDANILTKVESINPEQEEATVTVYYDNAYTLTIDGKPAKKETAGTGAKSTVEISLDQDKNYLQASVSNGTQTYELNVFVSNRVKMVSGFDAEDNAKLKVTNGLPSIPKEHITITDGSDSERTYAQVRIGAVDMGNEEYNSIYEPAVILEKASFFSDIAWRDIDIISFDLYNATDRSGRTGI